MADLNLPQAPAAALPADTLSQLYGLGPEGYALPPGTPLVGFPKIVMDAVMGLKTLPDALERSQQQFRASGNDPASLVPLATETALSTMGTGAIAGLPMRAGEVALGAGPIRAFHGSPHDFDAFDISKIGAGEGAQAYGHGLYFAENPGTAKSYRDTLAPDVKIGGQNYDMYNPLHAATVAVQESGSRAEAIKDVRAAIERDPGDPSSHFPKVLRILESDRELPEFQSSGKMYEVNINADPEHFLDWDKPLSEQYPTVQEALQKLGVENASASSDQLYYALQDAITNRIKLQRSPAPAEHQGSMFEEFFAPRLPQHLQEKLNNISVTVAQELRDAGIPGIRYLDQGSRGSGNGTHNYVVFDDKLIDILKKYGLAGVIGAGAAHFSLPAPQTDGQNGNPAETE